jgi:hypothetical protein
LFTGKAVTHFGAGGGVSWLAGCELFVSVDSDAVDPAGNVAVSVVKIDELVGSVGRTVLEVVESGNGVVGTRESASVDKVVNVVGNVGTTVEFVAGTVGCEVDVVGNGVVVVVHNTSVG